ncbi:hypothetical protein [Egbenema bharatensis]|uniref:hypothetical protein n=1 Tax=Egbenema bharatensis TaxID=3463334 RepID=UPI003A83C19C
MTVKLRLETIADILHDRGQNQADRTAFIFLQDGETESGRLTYFELDQRPGQLRPNYKPALSQAIASCCCFLPAWSILRPSLAVCMLG